MRKLQQSAKRLLVSFVILGAVCSGCASCRIKPPRQVMCTMNTSSENTSEWYSDCFDTETDDDGFVKQVKDMDKYICRSPDDEQVLEQWIKRVLISCSKKKEVKSFIEAFPLPIDTMKVKLEAKNGQ